MSVTLENLSSVLSEQHLSLCGKGENADKKSTKEYIIEGLAVTVLVNLERKSFDPGIQQEAQHGGVKLCKDIANVTVNPENEKVVSAVTSHFKGQVIPSMMGAPERPMFDEVVVNKEKII